MLVWFAFALVTAAPAQYIWVSESSPGYKGEYVVLPIPICLNLEKNCDRKCCESFCSDTERLEGSLRDVCVYLDKKCLTYKN
jgi:hypothetical protein